MCSIVGMVRNGMGREMCRYSMNSGNGWESDGEGDLRVCLVGMEGSGVTLLLYNGFISFHSRAP